MIQTEHQRRAYLEALGIDVWVPSDQAEPVDDGAVQQFDAGAVDWNQLRDTVASCTRCPLHESRTQTVFGVGSADAELVLELPFVVESADGSAR